MELAILENKLPLKAYPEKNIDDILETKFKYWLSNLLSIKPDKEENMDNAIKAIKMKFWSLGLFEIKACFTMYALGELDIEPRSNHIDVILVGQIFNAYKKFTRVKPEIKTSQEKEREYKENQDFLYCVQAFDYFLQTDRLPEESYWIYSYLVDVKKVVEFDGSTRVNEYKLKLDIHKDEEKAKIEAKISLIKKYFRKLNAKGIHINDVLNEN